MRASGYSRSAVWFLNQLTPRTQAALVWVMRSPSACSSISSQTHPQNVQVAFFTTVNSISSPLAEDLTARTGRQGESSAEGAAPVAAADAARHVATGLDLLPGRGLGRRLAGELGLGRPVRRVRGFVRSCRLHRSSLSSVVRSRQV